MKNSVSVKINDMILVPKLAQLKIFFLEHCVVLK
jgi:hypothetical protein